MMPVLGELRQKTGAPISIDTTKAIVARHALNAGAEIINDVTGLESDPAMLPLAAEAGAGVCVMHAQGTPRTMQERPTYVDVVAEVLEYLRRRRDALLAAGIPRDRIAVDPGIGFGKTAGHNLQLLSIARQFHGLGCPVLFGHSRKRFLGETEKGTRTGRSHGRHDRRGTRAWRVRACKSSASTTLPRSARHWCSSAPAAAWSSPQLRPGGWPAAAR